jgi:phosphoglycerate dehydrogenase-like enzyme
MKQITIAHDFNLKIYLYKFPKNESLKKIFDLKKIKFVDIKKVKKNDLSKIEIFWGNRLTLDIIDSLDNLKWVHLASSGSNFNVRKKLSLKKIKLSNSKGIYNKSVSQLILAFIFSICTGIHFLEHRKDKKKFNRLYFEKYIKFNSYIDQKKILILGNGEISKYLISKLKHFNKNISIVVKNSDLKKIKFKNKYSFNNLSKAFSENNLIINLLPENNETLNVINKKILNQLPKYSSFINASRGDIINHNDLINFIKKDKTFIYATDVFSRNLYVNPYIPLDYNSTLFKLKRVIMTPHIGAFSNDYWDEQLKLFRKNLELYFNSKKLVNNVK